MNDSTYIIFSKWQDYRDGKQVSALPEVRDDGVWGKERVDMTIKRALVVME